MKYIMIICVLFLSVSAFASDEYNEEIEKFFSLYEKGEISKSIDSIYSTNRWIDSSSDAAMNLKGQFSSMSQMVGDYLGKERIGVHSYGERLLMVTYLLLYERQPIRLEFMFYRPADSWIIYSFSFDDNTNEELKMSAREEMARSFR
jgi:hypothetical protein